MTLDSQWLTTGPKNGLQDRFDIVRLWKLDSGAKKVRCSEKCNKTKHMHLYKQNMMSFLTLYLCIYTILINVLTIYSLLDLK